MQIFGFDAITDDVVRAAVGGSAVERERILVTLALQVQAMIRVRLSPTPAQYHVVEDLAQQSLVALSEGLARLRNPTTHSLKSFTSVIVARRVADFLKRSNAVSQPPMASLDSTVGGPSTFGPLRRLLPAGGPSPHSGVANAEQIQQALAELGNLKAEHREVISLAFFDQLPVGEIAEQMELSRPAVSMLLIRAVKALRRNVTGSSRVGNLP